MKLRLIVPVFDTWVEEHINNLDQYFQSHQVEMPGEEEIEKEAHKHFTDSATNRNVLWKILGFKRGAKWMGEQMKSQIKQ